MAMMVDRHATTKGLGERGEAEAVPSLGDRYLCLERLGGGGMGVVYAAYDKQLDRKLAIKLLHPGRDDQAAPEQSHLLREARAMARLSHPNVVAIHDVGVADGRVFLAMDLVESGNLREWLDRGPTARAKLDALIAAGRGLAAAHEVGIVHRDFKLENVLLGKDGRVLVTDFGIARAEPSAGSGPPLTAAGGATFAGAGTIGYMAPEQARGEPVDARADQFSFGVALYFAFCGRFPFPAADLGSYLESIDAGPPISVEWSRAPARLRRAANRALARDPADRYPTMTEMLRDLARLTLRDVLFGMDYSFQQRAMPLLAVVAMTGQIAFHFLDRWLLGMRDSLPVRLMATLVAIPVIFFPRDRLLATWQKVYWEFSIAVTLFVFPYMYLLNGMNKYWFVSIVFAGVVVGFVAKAIILVPMSALTFVAAALTYAHFHGLSPGGARLVPVVAEGYIVFLITALVLSAAALGLEMTFRRAMEAEHALRQVLSASAGADESRRRLRRR
jgi:hypothetical protein